MIANQMANLYLQLFWEQCQQFKLLELRVVDPLEPHHHVAFGPEFTEGVAPRKHPTLRRPERCELWSKLLKGGYVG